MTLPCSAVRYGDTGGIISGEILYLNKDYIKIEPKKNKNTPKKLQNHYIKTNIYILGAFLI